MRYFLDITPTLLTQDGNIISLGTVRYEVDKAEVGNVYVGQRMFQRVPLDGGGPVSNIQFEMQVTEAARAPITVTPANRPTP